MTLAALAAMLWSLPAAAQEEYRQPALENPESWSVVVIPDLQGYAKNEASQPIARLMTAWIADNIERLNVRMCSAWATWSSRTTASATVFQAT